LHNGTGMAVRSCKRWGYCAVALCMLPGLPDFSGAAQTVPCNPEVLLGERRPEMYRLTPEQRI